MASYDPYVRILDVPMFLRSHPVHIHTMTMIVLGKGITDEI